jgi:hypothetical protein
MISNLRLNEWECKFGFCIFSAATNRRLRGQFCGPKINLEIYLWLNFSVENLGKIDVGIHPKKKHVV